MNKKPTETPEQPSERPSEPVPIVQPLIDEMQGTPPKEKGKEGDEKAPAPGPVHPPQPAELDQDAGGGYNPDHTYPQT